MSLVQTFIGASLLMLMKPVCWVVSGNQVSTASPKATEGPSGADVQLPPQASLEDQLGSESKHGLLLDSLMEKVSFLQPWLLRSNLSCSVLAEFHLLLPPFARDLVDLVMVVLYGALGCKERAGVFLADLIDDMGVDLTVSMLEVVGTSLAEVYDSQSVANNVAEGTWSLGVKLNIERITSCLLEIARKPKEDEQWGSGPAIRPCFGIQYANGSSLRGSVLSTHGTRREAEGECKELGFSCAGVHETQPDNFTVVGRNDSYVLVQASEEGGSWIQDCSSGSLHPRLSKRSSERRVTVFEQPSFQGDYAVFPETVDFVGEEWNGSISSLKVDACYGCVVTVCSGPGFTGICANMNSPTEHLDDKWDNTISSLRVKSQCSIQVERQIYQTVEYIPQISYFYNLATSIYYYSINCYSEAEERVESIIQDLGLDLANSLTGSLAQGALATIQRLQTLGVYASEETVRESLQEAIQSAVESASSPPSGGGCLERKGRKCREGGPSRKPSGKHHGKKDHPSHSHKHGGHPG
ncbi:uncharacterized protein apof [Narcine bancroftii]|uniref:uncharacterized protein apof n=1 Tax=Narcine bancroftii TaxID=1343680 RepID=UPI0038321009